MLIKAMEVTGIEGTYRRTCESVMSVLRRNKDSLMAVLEAFVYDPLLNWRLLDVAIEKTQRSKNTDDTMGSLSGSNEDPIELLSIGAVPKIKSSDLANINADSSMGLHQMHPTEATNKKARTIVDRVKQKLTGNDFNSLEAVSVQRQIDLLIQQATNNENLCQCYIGWCPFW